MSQNKTERSAFVVNGHHLKVTSRGPRNVRPTQWQCRGCDRQFHSIKNPHWCATQTLWVQLGMPGDGVGRCRDCETLFAFEYPATPAHEHPCPECGSLDWYRSDETDPDPSQVIVDVE